MVAKLKVNSKLDELSEHWSRLQERAGERKQRLADSYRLHTFLSEQRDLMNWYSKMSVVMSSVHTEESTTTTTTTTTSSTTTTTTTAKDVSGPEVLIERHVEHRSELESRDDTLAKTVAQGRRFVDETPFDDNKQLVNERIAQLESERARLGELWRHNQELFAHSLQVQMFMRDAEQADAWIGKQDAFLANETLGDSLDDVEALIKKHDDFDKSLAAQEDKAKFLEDAADELIAITTEVSSSIQQQQQQQNYPNVYFFVNQFELKKGMVL